MEWTGDPARTCFRHRDDPARCEAFTVEETERLGGKL